MSDSDKPGRMERFMVDHPLSLTAFGLVLAAGFGLALLVAAIDWDTYVRELNRPGFEIPTLIAAPVVMWVGLRVALVGIQRQRDLRRTKQQRHD